MPIYEYQCTRCRNQFQHLILKSGEEERLSCPACGETDLKKLISRVVYHVSGSERLANYDPKVRQSDNFYKDSRNIGLHAEKQAEKMGVDLGDGFRNKLEKLRTDPGSVLRDSE